MEVATFLAGKGVFETLDYFSYVRLHGFQGNLLYYLFMSLIKFFTDEVWREYKLF